MNNDIDTKIDLYLIDEGAGSSLVRGLLKKGKKYLIDSIKNVLEMAVRELNREIQYKLSNMNTKTKESGDIRRQLVQLNREAHFHKARYLEILQKLEEFATENWDNYNLKTSKELDN